MRGYFVMFLCVFGRGIAVKNVSGQQKTATKGREPKRKANKNENKSLRVTNCDFFHVYCIFESIVAFWKFQKLFEMDYRLYLSKWDSNLSLKHPENSAKVSFSRSLILTKLSVCKSFETKVSFSKSHFESRVYTLVRARNTSASVWSFELLNFKNAAI